MSALREKDGYIRKSDFRIQMISDGVSKEDIVRNITAKYAQTAHGKKYLVNYLATKWLTNDFQRMDQQRLIQLQESGETIKITTG